VLDAPAWPGYPRRPARRRPAHGARTDTRRAGLFHASSPRTALVPHRRGDRGWRRSRLLTEELRVATSWSCADRSAATSSVRARCRPAAAVRLPPPPPPCCLALSRSLPRVYMGSSTASVQGDDAVRLLYSARSLAECNLSPRTARSTARRRGRCATSRLNARVAGRFASHQLTHMRRAPAVRRACPFY